MYPGDAGLIGRDVPAVVMTGSGDTVTWGQLDEQSNRLAQFWFAQGLRPGDHVALLVENVPEFFEICWAAERSGLFYTTINSHLTAPEVSYILGNCEARSLIVSAGKRVLAAQALADGEHRRVTTRLAIGGAGDGFDSYEAAMAASSSEQLDYETAGQSMLYSSGTTGRPKGVWRPLSGQHPRDDVGVSLSLKLAYSGGPGMHYLSPAPLYHAAPLGFTVNTQRLGGTVHVMERFDAQNALACIERFSITHSQWVPTMFSRLLKLPEAVRNQYDLSSHRVAIHAAAPCPVPVKRAIIEWWGPIVYEYYAGTEGSGSTAIASEEWLAHPGTVGRAAVGAVHILDDDGHELPAGEPGAIFFEGPTATAYRYFGDEEKTASSRNAHGWSTLGDVGYLDTDGYLFLTDRKAYMIITGGTNVYPQETENVLTMHPKVADVAVFGVPDEDLGEVVKAVVQLMPGFIASADIETELIAYCKSQLATIKCPRTVDFEDELPRLPTGKLYKRILRDKYWAGRTLSGT